MKWSEKQYNRKQKWYIFEDFKEKFKVKISLFFGFIFLLCMGPGLIWVGFNDQFSIGDIIRETTSRRGQILSSEIREYGTFLDILSNRILPIFIGSLFSYGLLVLIKEFFSSDNH